MTQSADDTTTESSPNGSTRRSWMIDAEARVVTCSDGVLVRRGHKVTRLGGGNVSGFLSALLERAEDGRIDLPTHAVPAEKEEQLTRFLGVLEDAGLLIELNTPGDPLPGDPVTTGLWQRAHGTVDRADIAARLRTVPVAVVGSGALADRVRSGLVDAGVHVQDTDTGTDKNTVEQGREPGLAVVVGAHDEDPLLTEWNERALAAPTSSPWLVAIPFNGEHATVGPWIVPGQSACFRCYQLRRASTHSVEAVTPELADASMATLFADPSPRYPGLNLMQSGLVVDRVTDHVGLSDHGWQAVPGGLTTISVSMHGIGMESHRVLRVPRCPACSPAQGRGYPQVWHNRPIAESAQGDSDEQVLPAAERKHP